VSVKLILVAACALVDADGRVLLAERPAGKTMAGLWEFPGGKLEKRESLEQAAAREVLEETGVNVRIGAKIASIRHAYSHFKITLHAFEAAFVSGKAKALGCQAVKWVRKGELAAYAFPKANRALLAFIR